MEHLTPRMKKILMVMLQEDRIMAVKELAEKVGVSKRTVQRELEAEKNSLSKYNLTFVSKTGKGVWISGDEEEKQRLLGVLTGNDNYDVSDREDRRKRLILEILKEKGLKKLFYYASQFQVSEATISSDLEAVEGWLESHHLQVVRKPGSGISIEGREKDYREAIRAFIEENLDTKVLREAYDVSGGTRVEEHRYKSNLGQVLDDAILKRVVQCLTSMENKRMLTLTESSYTGLVLHISIAISRILKDEIMEQPKQWQEQMLRDEDFLLAEEIAGKLSEEFQVDIPEIETAYICLHIKGAKHQNIEWNGTRTVEMERQELLELINHMINAYDGEQAYGLKQDSEFIQGLLAHLQPTFIRLIYDMKISNPMLADIKESYPEIYEKSKQAAKVLSEWIQKPVPEEEIGFLTIHFGAAQVRMEGKKERLRQVSVGIICASGIGISRLMLSKMEKLFQGRIRMETYGKNDLTPYIIEKTDFFVSSIPISQEGMDLVFVNPLMNEKDVEKIRQKVHTYERMPIKQQEETAFSVELDQINQVANQIKTVLRHVEIYPVKADISFAEMTEAISKAMTPYKDRQEMIQSAIEAREKLGSQIFAEFGFGLLHTRTEGVIRPSFTIWLPEEGNVFLDSYFHEIQVVFVMLLPVDEHKKINSEILGYISSHLIEDYDFLMAVSSGDLAVAKESLSGILQRFFNQYLNRLQNNSGTL